MVRSRRHILRILRVLRVSLSLAAIFHCDRCVSVVLQAIFCGPEIMVYGSRCVVGYILFFAIGGICVAFNEISVAVCGGIYSLAGPY